VKQATILIGGARVTMRGADDDDDDGIWTYYVNYSTQYLV
jgi:surface antigen